MTTMLGSLLISLGLESGQFKSGLTQADKDLKKATKSWERTGQSISAMGQNLTMSLTPALIGIGAAAVKGANDQAQAMAQVESALASMGDASGKTAEELLKASDALEMNSLIDGDVILRDITANLLTFGNVAGEVFDRAQQAAVDMATRLGGDPKSAAIMLGKALNDPIKGITALTRVGVSFTAQQQEQIKAMAAAGDTAGAQALILSELEKQYGGAAKAAADTSPWRQAQVALGQIGDTIGEILIPYIKQAAEVVRGFGEWFKGLSPTMQSVIVGVAGFAAVLGPLLMVVGPIVSAMAPFIAALSAIGASGGVGAAASAGVAGLGAALGPLLPIIAAVAAAGVVLYTQWDKIQPVLAKVAAGMQEALGPKVAALVESFKGAMVKLQPVFDAIGEVISGFLKVMGPIWTATFASVIDVVTGFVSVFGDIFSGLFKLLTGDFNGAMDSFKSAARTGLDVVLKIFGNFWTATKSIFANFGVNLVQIGRDMIAGLVRGIQNAGPMVLRALLGVATNAVSGVKDFLGIKSPSRLFMQIGGFVSEGLAIGITNGKPQVLREIMAMTSEMTAAAESGLADMFQETEALMDRLTPNRSRNRQYAADRATIDKSVFLSPSDKADMRKKLLAELVQDTFGPALLAANDQMQSKLGATQRIFATFKNHMAKDVAKPVTLVVRDMADAVAQAAQNIGNAMRSIGDAFKNGGFWDKLGAIADLVAVGANAYGSIAGVFKSGGNAQSGALSAIGVKLAGARASGGPVMAGKTYLVGERGKELFTPNQSGYITPNNALATSIKVEASPYFDVRVNGQIAQAAPAIAQGGASLARMQSARAQSRRVR